MIEAKFTNTIELFSGQIGLTDKQADRRPGCLKKVKKGVYEIVRPVQIKAGEAISLPEIPKIFMPLLDETIAKKLQVKAEAEMRARKAEAEANGDADKGKDDTSGAKSEQAAG